MSQISIKVKIAGRYYPLSIKPEEETTIRQAEMKIQSSIDAFQEKYGVRDHQDLLAMTLLQMATKPTTSEKTIETVVEKVEVVTDITPDLERLNQLAESYIL